MGSCAQLRDRIIRRFFFQSREVSRKPWGSKLAVNLCKRRSGIDLIRFVYDCEWLLWSCQAPMLWLSGALMHWGFALATVGRCNLAWVVAYSCNFLVTLVGTLLVNFVVFSDLCCQSWCLVRLSCSLSQGKSPPPPPVPSFYHVALYHYSNRLPRCLLFTPL